MSVFLLDLDFFKEINDTYGHLAGDEVLRNTARRITETVRQPDIVGRYGGEEFAVILPETNLQGAHTVAERLRQVIAGSPVVYNEQELTITTSIGVAIMGPSTADYESLLNQADLALYQSKTAGRNQVTCYKENGSIDKGSSGG